MFVGFPSVSHPGPLHLQMLWAGETMAGLVAALSSSRANVLGIALVGHLDDSATSGHGAFLRGTRGRLRRLKHVWSETVQRTAGLEQVC